MPVALSRSKGLNMKSSVTFCSRLLFQPMPLSICECLSTVQGLKVYLVGLNQQKEMVVAATESQMNGNY